MYMNTLNSAVVRNNLSRIIEKVAKKREPVAIGRFGQPKAVLVDILTYNWQKQAIALIKRIDTLTPSEIETLNILLDDHAREALLVGLQQAQAGDLIPLSKFGKS